MIVADPQLLERRPIAIKITQYPRYVRPQLGLTLADVAFEYYIEDGLTRFIAVFYGNNSDMVGPVRSGRYFDEHVVRMYQAFFVFKYADPRVYDYYKKSDLERRLIVPGVGIQRRCERMAVPTSNRPPATPALTNPSNATTLAALGVNRGCCAMATSG